MFFLVVCHLVIYAILIHWIYTLKRELHMSDSNAAYHKRQAAAYQKQILSPHSWNNK